MHYCSHYIYIYMFKSPCLYTDTIRVIYLHIIYFVKLIILLTTHHEFYPIFLCTMQLYSKKSIVRVVIETFVFSRLNNVLYEETKYTRVLHDANFFTPSYGNGKKSNCLVITAVISSRFGEKFEWNTFQTYKKYRTDIFVLNDTVQVYRIGAKVRT